MTDRTSEEIIELARRQMQAREQASIEQRATRELPWRYALFGFLAALLLGLLAWPDMPLNWKMYAVVHGVCAQIHNVEMGGMQLPICARNTGIYSSFIVTCLALVGLGRARASGLPPWPISAALGLFVLAMAVDGFNSMAVDLFLPHLYTPTNELRTLTGIGMGVAVAVLVILILNTSLRANAEPDQPIIASWLELGGVLLLNLLVLAAMYGNIELMFWPIAVSAWLGIIGVLFSVNLLVTALLLGYDGRVSRLVQLARPALFALLFTLAELGALASLRFWMESSGMIAV